MSMGGNFSALEEHKPSQQGRLQLFCCPSGEVGEKKKKIKPRLVALWQLYRTASFFRGNLAAGPSLQEGLRDLLLNSR